jgi:hypothetical protein
MVNPFLSLGQYTYDKSMHATQLQREAVLNNTIKESEACTLDSFQKAIGASKVANPVSCLFVIFFSDMG